MKPSRLLALSILSVAASCGGGAKKPATNPTDVTDTKPDDKPLPPPPPPCVKAGDAAVWGASSDGTKATFCTGERGSSSPDCFDVDLASGEYKKAAGNSGPLTATAPIGLQVTTTPTEVTVCMPPAPAAAPAEGVTPPEEGTSPMGEPKCTVIKPKVAKGAADQLVATANDRYAVIINGAVAEVWDIAKNKKLKDLKFAKGDYKCATPVLYGENVVINAKMCDAPSARASVWAARAGKRTADIGGKNFGTFGEAGLQAVELDGSTVAFLEEFGASVAIQEIGKGKIVKTIDLAGLWQTGAADGDAAPAGDPAAEGDAAKPADEAPAPAAIGNPGASLLVSAGTGKLVVVSGGPTPGNLAWIDTATGEAKILPAPVCK